ncbi:MAG: hypothetical protein LBC02_05265 [Planctomycetaceae bacterium]|jgi:hypothetical protein|nr:hypothetical protein [Planctomycetaceae bacterium]
MKITQSIKKYFLHELFDPCDLFQMDPPESFRSGKFTVDLDERFDPYEGFRNSMQLLADSLSQGINNVEKYPEFSGKKGE